MRRMRAWRAYRRDRAILMRAASVGEGLKFTPARQAAIDAIARGSAGLVPFKGRRTGMRR